MTSITSFEHTLEQANSGFIHELGDKIQWQWDPQFQCLLAEFSVDHEQHVYLIAKKHFPLQWDKKTLKKANPQLRHRAGFFSTLEKAQLLMSKDESGQHDTMLSWWPWGHGATISIRLFLANNTPYKEPCGILTKVRNIIS